MSLPHYRQSAILDAAGFRHAFFLRGGGLSEGDYASLNFSWAVGDHPSRVDGNLALAARALGVPTRRVYFAAQVHGAATLTLDGDEAWEHVLHREADAVIAQRADLACGVRTADCVPVLLGDRRSGAAAAVHAGWRGLVAGILREAVAEIAERSPEPLDLVAAIGPHISVDAFEVSEEVAAQLAACADGADVVRRDLGPKPHVDLGRTARAQLLAAGVGEANLDAVPGCTYREPEELFSYRRDGPRSGRHLSAIVPAARPPGG